MKNNLKSILIILLVFVFVYILLVWARPAVAEYRWRLHAHDTELDLATAFATALITNHPAAYDWIDPSLKPRLDEWMNTHQGKNCTYDPDWFFVGPDINGEYDVSFGCYGTDEWIELKIENIVIKEMIVIDWGEVREGG